MHCYVSVSFCSTCNTDASYNFLDCRLVDEIIKPQSIGVLEFEFVVVGKKAEEKKWFKCTIMGIKVMSILTMSAPQTVDQIVKHTFIREGKRSR